MVRSLLTHTLAGIAAGLVAGTAWAGDIVLNELQADNLTSVVNAGDHPDWLELYNNNSSAMNLAGMSLSDDPTVPRFFTFPANTVIPGHGRLIVWCDDVVTASGLHTGFALNAEGQTVTLYAAGAVPQAVDAVTFGPQVPDLSLGRVPDGTGNWQLCQPTAGAANVVQALGSATKVRINEWMASPNSGDDWFELYNPDTAPVALGGLSLTDTLGTPDLSPIPALSYIAAGGFLRYWADQKPSRGATHANFKLSAGGEAIGLYNGKSAIDAISFQTQLPGVSEGRIPDGANTIVRFPKTDSPGESNYLLLTNVVVNEVLAHTDPPLEDAVEFYNPGATSVDISGWYLSNNRSVPKKYVVPAGTVIPAGGYQVFYQYQFFLDSSDPASFTFNSAHGDEVVLSQVAGGALTGYRAYEKFGSTANGMSLGRYLTSTGKDFTTMSARTFGQDNPVSLAQFRQGKGATNAPPLVGPLVINEIMYHPPDIIVGSVTNDNTLDEFIELQNVATAALPLYDPLHPENTWRLRDAVDFRFPTGTTLAAQGLLLVVNFDPATNATVLADFRAKYAVPAGVAILGPYKGKLNNDGEPIELVKPDPPQEYPHPDVGYVPYILVDRVNYKNQSPWPVTADGTGLSLQRKTATGYGNDPVNWSAASPTAGRGNGQIAIDSIRISSGRVVLAFLSQAGATYTVQYRDGSPTGTWSKLLDLAAVTTSQVREVNDPLGSQDRVRFYRLVSPSVP